MPADYSSITVHDIIKVASDTDRTLPEEANDIARWYHDLCLALATPERIGDQDLNWCGFAQWSSKAIGVSLRLENTSPLWTRFLSAFRIPKILGAPVRAIVRFLLGGSYGKALSFANRSIFLEIGTLYTNLLDDEPDDKVWRSASFAEHKLNGAANDDLLRIGARLLQQAMREPKPDHRNEMVLGASVALSAYEQARAQPAWEFVFYRPVRWLLRISWRTPYHLITRKPLHRFDIYTECHEDQPALVRKLEARWARLYSRALALDTPLGPIWLGRKLERPPGFPDPPLLGPIHNAEVRYLVERFRREDEDPDRGVVDWLDYGERMRFIVGYFMMYQNVVPEMFQPPFREPSRRREPSAVRTLPSMLSRIPVPRIVDPALDELKQLDVEPVREVSLSRGVQPTGDAEPPCRCESQRRALELTKTNGSEAPGASPPSLDDVACVELMAGRRRARPGPGALPP